uniref:Bifunctional inhibitor/plant lipid transfer protein/seed storage helical domain-containing protein n=1 Tax=Oryza nivara TaxID=4536 RepID=A0A0E0I9Z8_ORYNI
MNIIFVFALLAIAACSATAQFDVLGQNIRQYQVQSPLLLQQQAIAQQLHLQQFGDLYIDQNLAQAQALLAFSLPSTYGIYPSYYSAPSSITTLGGILY